MDVLCEMDAVRAWRRAQCGPVVLVPTMGALHEGHLVLIRRARELAGPGGVVAVTIFVNPLQFGVNEDLERYPRTLESDLLGSEEAGADLVWVPEVGEVYAVDRSVMVRENALAGVLCGRSRPGHFDGVCTVVCKLFNLFQPDRAVFGKKDYQQLAIIRRLVRDLNVPVDVVGVETVREADGLAMSSRNRYLTGEERVQACALRGALLLARERYRVPGVGAGEIVDLVREKLVIEAPLGRVDYVELVDAHTLEAAAGEVAGRELLLALAVHFGRARLIDNLELWL